MKIDQKRSAVKCELPKYLENFTISWKDVPAGHRHTIYWHTDGTDKSKLERLSSIAGDTSLTEGIEVGKIWEALQERFKHMTNGFRHNGIQVTEFPIELQDSLLCGSGLSHLTEVGMSFMNPYGIPYIPGSSIKGILRDAAQMLAYDKTDSLTHDDVNDLFGIVGGSKEDENQVSRMGHLQFLDSFPQEFKNLLDLDILTPHHKSYFQDNGYPHDEEDPIPIPYLVVKKGAKFKLAILHDHHNSSEQEIACSKKVQRIVEYAIEHMGFGAKTSIGYGWMKIDEKKMQKDQENRDKAREAEAKRRQQEADQAKAAALRQAERESLSEDERWAYDLVERVQANNTTNDIKPATIVKQCLKAIDDSATPEQLKALAERLGTKIMEGKLLDQSTKKDPRKDDVFQASEAIKTLMEGKVAKWGGI